MVNENVLKFDDGFEDLKINGDANRVIRFNPTSGVLLKKIEKAHDDIVSELKNIEENKEISDEEKFELLDKFIKAQIDEIFGVGTSEIVFAGEYSITTVNGNYIYENFLIAVMDYMTAKIKAETEKSQKRIEEYTKKAEELKK